MEKPSRVYVTYIATTPEKLWEALTDPDITEQYWAHHRNVSTYEIGSSWEHHTSDGEVQVVGEIKEFDPPRRLVHTFANESRKDEPDYHTTVAYDIEPTGDAVCLTVTHTDLNDEILPGIEGGWPKVLSALKTHLETDSPLAIWNLEAAKA
jgi:uncharacterized protein YndB with AHSA1/START domain